MKSGKQFVLVFLIVAIVALSILPAVNIFTDFSRVFNKDYDYHYMDNRENLGYLKVAYLLEHKDEFSCLVFGSSRVRVGFDTAILEKYLGGSWYKMEYPAGLAYHHFSNLYALIENGFVPSQVLLTISDFDMWSNNSERNVISQYNGRLYPVGFFEMVDFYRFYLFKVPRKSEIDILRGNLTLKKSNRIVRENGGMGIPEKENAKKHREKLLKMAPYQKEFANIKYDYSEAIKYIKLIKNLCNRYNIKLYVAILPSTPKTLIARNHNSINSFKRELVNIVDFYDFNGIYEITKNLSNWLEMSHFRTTIGNAMVRAISVNSMEVGNFGTLVTESNIEHHLNLVDSGIRKNLPKLLEDDENIYISNSLLPFRSGSGQDN